MGGLLHLLLRSHTLVTSTLLVVTIQLLSLQEGKNMALHHVAQIIRQIQESMAFRRQDSRITLMSVLEEVSWKHNFGFVAPLTIDLFLGMSSACKTIPFESCFCIFKIIYTGCLHSVPSKLSWCCTPGPDPCKPAPAITP